jgi:hypothetical protein
MSHWPRRNAGGNRVCMMVHHYFPRDPRVRREALALARAGQRVTVLCLRRPGEPKRETWQGISIVRLPVQRHRGSPLPVYLAEYLAFAGSASLAGAWLAAQQPFDVVHVHTPPDFLLAAALPMPAGGAPRGVGNPPPPPGGDKRPVSGFGGGRPPPRRRSFIRAGSGYSAGRPPAECSKPWSAAPAAWRIAWSPPPTHFGDA